MERNGCSPEERANCPLRKHFQDWHHVYFQKRMYVGALETEWRNEPDNKRLTCRFIHNAIHASGYIPEKPSRAEMREDLANGHIQSADDEYQDQLEIANMFLERVEDTA